MKLEQLLHQVVAGYLINYGVHHCIGVSNLYNAHHNHNGAEIESDPTPHSYYYYHQTIYE